METVRASALAVRICQVTYTVRRRNGRVETDAVTTVCGSEDGFKHGKCLAEAKFCAPAAICADPINPACYYVGDLSSVRYCTPDTVTLIAGGERPGFADGVGAAAQFNGVCGLLCTSASGGDTLIVADFSTHRIRSVNIKTQIVMTIAGDEDCPIGNPRKLAFDRSHGVKPESALFLTSHAGLRRLNLQTRELITCEWAEAHCFLLCGLASTPSGHLIVSCLARNAIYVYDPITSRYELIAGHATDWNDPFADGPGQIARFNRPDAVVVVAIPT